MIALDAETTSLTGPTPLPLIKQPYIVELTVAILDDATLRETKRVTTMMKPGIKISDEVTRITGITEKDINGAMPFGHHYKQLCSLFLGQRAIVAHNCAFDSTCLEIELKRIGRLTQFPWPPQRFCTVELTTHLKGRRLALKELWEIATNGKTPPKAHRTDGDVTMLITCIQWLRRQKLM